MMTVLVAIMMQTLSPGPESPILCDFPGAQENAKLIHIELEPQPSLRDQPGLYRVAMKLDGQEPMSASAKPIPSTQDRDVLIQGRAQIFTYSLGLRDDGMAALNISRKGASAAEVKKTTRIGYCHGQTEHMQRWLLQ